MTIAHLTLAQLTLAQVTLAQLTLAAGRAYHRALFAPDSEPISSC